MDGKLEELRQSKEYETLVSTRSKIKWPLAILMLAVYYGFVMVIAFEPEIFGTKIGDGHTSLGIVVGLLVILFSFVITGIYVHKANKTLEPLVEKLHEKAGDA